MYARITLIFWTALSCCLATAMAHAQPWAEKMFSSLEHDFEVVARGARAEHAFLIKNLYKEDLHIASVRSSCGCTDPTISKRTLKTGETAQLVAAFNTHNFDGAHTATLTVVFDQPYPAEVRLKVSGFVRKDVVLHPGRVEFGAVDAGTPVERKIKVTYAGRPDWKIIDVRSRNTNFEVELNPLPDAAGLVSYEMTVRLKPDATPGYINDHLTIVTNDESRRTIPLAVEGNILAGLAVSPQSLHFGSVAPGETITKQIVVRSKKAFRIVKVACADDCFKFGTSDVAKTVHLVPVKFTASEKQGKVVEKILITTDAESTPAEVVAYAEVEG